ncbi:Qat anti-phage system TatD family nuclease QatD [Marinomonas flavescens]|uniref:Qat anti-phage system TatD family nuclease QatD n=1 Tax=Marinomonas flavescens TaxID=2529379 RepID=UPI001055DC86|nr:Qat anti-phage system TatD family nuclease QatD [Marinomonas flavescens]
MMDLHCHIDLYPDPQAVIDECIQNRLYVLSVTTTPKAWHGTYALTSKLPRFNTSLGLHPQLAHQRLHELPLFDSLVSETRFIGEIGLDGTKNHAPYMESQLEAFQHILKKCQEYDNKIMTIHTLSAVTSVLDELEKHPGAGVPILHWFLGTKKELTRAISLGCYFSIGPAMTVSKRGKKVIEWIPRDRILIETDGPFAALEGVSLKPIDSYRVCDYLAGQWQTDLDYLFSVLKTNLRNVLA